MTAYDPVVTKSVLDNSLDELRATIIELATLMDRRFEQAEQKANERFEQFEKRADERFDTIEKKADERFNKILNILDGSTAQIDNHDVDNTARDAQLARHDRWIHTLADKTKTKLN